MWLMYCIQRSNRYIYKDSNEKQHTYAYAKMQETKRKCQISKLARQRSAKYKYEARMAQIQERYKEQERKARIEFESNKLISANVAPASCINIPDILMNEVIDAALACKRRDQNYAEFEYELNRTYER
jgi:hypothetical protein